jgi:hypothetical protein
MIIKNGDYFETMVTEIILVEYMSPDKDTQQMLTRG